ncbi:hypothetical protein Hdeb2414_s0002g00063241 [Helianthus debilis subsp. tardiflorus]
MVGGRRAYTVLFAVLLLVVLIALADVAEAKNRLPLRGMVSVLDLVRLWHTSKAKLNLNFRLTGYSFTYPVIASHIDLQARETKQ